MAAHNIVLTGLIREIRRLVGDQLSKLPRQPSQPTQTQLAAVIKDRTKGLRPAYPFIVCDLDASQESTPWLKEEYYDEDEDVQVYVNEQRIPISITCNGVGSMDILNELRIKLDYTVDRWALNKETGATFQYCDSIKEIPSFLSTDFVEAATMTMYFVAETIYKPVYEDAKDIQRVIATGENIGSVSDLVEPFQVHVDTSTSNFNP